jgi:hypothetical protein
VLECAANDRPRTVTGATAEYTDGVVSRPGMSGDFIRWKDEVHATFVVLPA